MRLDGRRYTTEDDFQWHIEREWREWFSLFPEVVNLSPEEQAKFKAYTKRVIDHLNEKW